VYNSTNNPTIASWQNRPVGKKYTVAHELGHLFGGEHNLGTNGPADPGLMASSTVRTSGVFSNVTVNAIRGGLFTDHTGVQKKVTHP
jgi:hypothetical protein